MPCSLVSAATLGFDLVRLPAGREVAAVLLTGLDADAAALHALAAAHPGRGRDQEQRRVLAGRARRARELAAAVPTLRDGAPAALPDDGERATALLVAQLERATVTDAAALDRLVRDDVLGPEHACAGSVPPAVREAAADVLADAAVGHWAAGVLPPLVRRGLTAPAGRATRLLGPAPAPADRTELPALPAFAAGAPPLPELLDRLRTLDHAGRERWRAAVDEGRAERRPWAAAMHDAAWAAHLTGRTRALAAAQLTAVAAFLDAGFTGSDGAGGVWNAVSGCVQALAVADVLDDDALQLLTAPWRSVAAG